MDMSWASYVIASAHVIDVLVAAVTSFYQCIYGSCICLGPRYLWLRELVLAVHHVL